MRLSIKISYARLLSLSILVFIQSFHDYHYEYRLQRDKCVSYCEKSGSPLFRHSPFG